MPTELRKPSIQFLVLAIGVVLLTGFAFILSSAGLASSGPATTGRLDVGGVFYDFAPATCSVTEDGFVTAGGGTIDGEPFWVSASADRLDLALGQDSETERPSDEELWLINVSSVGWRQSDGSVTATALLRDERDTESVTVRGRLSVDCPA